MTCSNPTDLRVDMTLSRKFGSVERIIFRLVLNGWTNTHGICELLRLFSRPVLANGICDLVNGQVLSVDTSSGTLSISEPLVALISATKAPITVALPDPLAGILDDEGILTIGTPASDDRVLYQASHNLKSALLQQLLSGINLDLYIDRLDFVLTKQKGSERVGHTELG